MFHMPLIAILIVVGCFHGSDPKNLCGNYFLNVDTRDSLFVNLDGSYIHKYSSKQGEIFQSSGDWEYDSIRQRVIFKDFRFFSDMGADDLPPGEWRPKIDYSNSNEVRLIYSSEDNVYFKKEAP